jgi:hypothetical protein
MNEPNTDPESTQSNEIDPAEVITPDGDHAAAEGDSGGEGESEALAKVRREAKNLRDRAKAAEARVDELSRQVFALKVAALDKFADPSDFAYDADLVDDDEALTAAVDELITRRPHYAKPRKPSGSVGQGQRGNDAGPKDFSSLLR